MAATVLRALERLRTYLPGDVVTKKLVLGEPLGVRSQESQSPTLYAALRASTTSPGITSRSAGLTISGLDSDTSSPPLSFCWLVLLSFVPAFSAARFLASGRAGPGLEPRGSPPPAPTLRAPAVSPGGGGTLRAAALPSARPRPAARAVGG